MKEQHGIAGIAGEPASPGLAELARTVVVAVQRRVQPLV